jgi:hypothetical protein
MPSEKEELQEKLKAIRAEELTQCQEELNNLLTKYNVSIGFDLAYIEGNLSTKMYIKDDNSLK